MAAAAGYQERDRSPDGAPHEGRQWDMHRMAFLWSWDIAQPAPPPQSMWVVDSYNATTAAVGIKRLVIL